MRISPGSLADVIGNWSADGRGPLYARLVAALRAAIGRGAIEPGAMLPPERALAEYLSVSRTTVVSAYQTLKDAAVLESRQGRGTWVAGAARPDSGRSEGAIVGELYKNIDSADPTLISFAAAACPAPPIVRDVVSEFDPAVFVEAMAGNGYVPAGLPALRSAVADMLSGRGLRTDASQILITAGALEAGVLAGRVFADAGDTVIMEDPTFPGSLDAFRSAGYRIAGIPVDSEGMQPDHLEEIVVGQRPAFIFVMPTYHNPTGVALHSDRRRRIAEIAAEHNVPIVEDLTLDRLALGDALVPPPIASSTYPGALVCTVGSLSKTIWGGLRLGWVRAGERTMDRLCREKMMDDHGCPLPVQQLALHLLPHFDTAVDQIRSRIRDGRRALGDALGARLPDWTWNEPDGGSALWVKIPTTEARRFTQLAQRHGVLTVAGPAFSPAGAHNDHLRLPFVLDVDTIREAVRRLARAWDEFAVVESDPDPGAEFVLV